MWFTIAASSLYSFHQSMCESSVASAPAWVAWAAMISFFGERFYEDQHSLTVASLPGTVNKLYVKCQDAAGNSNNRDYLIQYSIFKCQKCLKKQHHNLKNL